MPQSSYDLHGTRLLECAPEGNKIRNDHDAVHLIGEAASAGADTVVVPVERLDDEFFRLRTGSAGQIVQKFVQYRRRLVIMGDISRYVAESTAFAAFVHEANEGEDIWFVADLAKLEGRLKAVVGPEPTSFPSRDRKGAVNGITN